MHSGFIILWCIAIHKKLKEQIGDVDAAQSKEVPLFWCGMAEVSAKEKAFISVKVFLYKSKVEMLSLLVFLSWLCLDIIVKTASY